MEKLTIVAFVAVFVLLVGTVFVAADFLGNGEATESEETTQEPELRSCGEGSDCGAGCGGSCGGSCGVASCGCGR